MSNPTTIFLIDDDKFLIDMYTLKLSNGGFAVESSTSGVDALKRLRDGFAPDIILLDIIMPTIDGLEILQTIQKEHLAPESMIIMLSNQADDEAKAKSLGAKGFIVKAMNVPSQVVTQVKEIYLHGK